VKSFRDILEAAWSLDPAAPAILAPGRLPLSYRALTGQSALVELQLRTAGIGPGDCVASYLPNGPEAAAAFLAFTSACIYAPLNPDDDETSVRRTLQRLRPAAVLTEGPRSPALAGIPVIELYPLASDPAGTFRLVVPAAAPRSICPVFDPACGPGLLLSTSGTTAEPKFVRHSHETLAAALPIIIGAHSLTPADRCLNLSPLFHTLGLIGSVLIAAASGGSVICPPGLKTLDLRGWMETLSPNWFAAVPTVQLALVEWAADHQDFLGQRPFRFIRCGGSGLTEDLRRRIEQSFHSPVIQVLGLSECPPISYDPFPPATRKPGSVGRVTGPEVAIWDDDGDRLPTGVAGNIVVRGANISPGYYAGREATRAAFVRGWFQTGDCGYLDEDGFLFLTGRTSDFINRGGEKVSPFEVESVFATHPDVNYVTAFPISDPRLGEEIAIAIVPRHEGAVTSQQLARFATSRLAFHKIPRRFHLVDAIPTGRTGKPDRKALRARFDYALPEPVQAPPHVAPRSGLERTLSGIWTQVLNVADPGIHDNFFECGGDSLAAAAFFAALADAMQTEQLTLGVLLEAPAIAELAVFLSRSGSMDHSSVTALRPFGSLTPLLWLGGFETVPALGSLDPDRPVFVISLPSSSRDYSKPSISAFADEYVKVIRQFRPTGPYLLAGWCASGVIGVEVASRLLDAGEDVPAVILFDARGVLPIRGHPLRAMLIRSLFAAQKLRYHAAHALRSGAGAGVDYAAKRVRSLVRSLWRRMFPSIAVARQTDDVEFFLSSALRNHNPAPYPGRMIHIWAQDRPKGLLRSVEFEWGPIAAGPLELHETPGNHLSMFYGDKAQALGALIERCLRRYDPAVHPGTPPEPLYAHSDTLVPQA
jgi:acyl-CoA synthetase (AMP-forming)/AMP-acid ligase II/thioesterase domain-containing protein